MYAKLIDAHNLECAPINKGNVVNFGTKANEAELLAKGYLPVVDGEIPAPGEYQTLREVFAQENDKIIRGFEAAPPEPDRITEIMLALAELAEAVLGGEE